MVFHGFYTRQALYALPYFFLHTGRVGCNGLYYTDNGTRRLIAFNLKEVISGSYNVMHFNMLILVVYQRTIYGIWIL